MLLIKLGINKYGSRKLFGCVLQAEGNCMQVRVSVFKWFETDGLISQRRDWLIGFKPFEDGHPDLHTIPLGL